jgi:6-phosphogluconolactonase (cycloisomerase 2 family)
MSKRSWLLGVGALVLIGLLLACGSNYNASQDGLLLVGSQGSGLIETFSFTLSNGHISAIANTPTDTSSQTCVLNGLPGSMVMDPAGVYAYAILLANSSCSGSKTGIAAFKVSSDGNITQAGSLVSLASANVLIQGTTTSEAVGVVPATMSMDTAGKFLFVADRATTDSSQRFVPGAVSVFAIGSGGSLTEVSGSPFFAVTPATTVQQSAFDMVSVAPTPTVFPNIGISGVQNSVCSAPGNNPPTAEFLYAVDDLGYQVFEFQVDTSSGVLTPPTGHNLVPAFPADTVPLGVAVDPCDRFAYVSDSLSNKVSAYQVCSVVMQPTCVVADGSLVPIPGSPFLLAGGANKPGPIVVDPYGNYVYTLGTLSNTISPFKISPVTGALTAFTMPTIATGVGPVSIVIRGDDNWMFVANYGNTALGGSTVSQYSIAPSTGLLTAEPVIQTDNYPWGLAVK